MEQKNLKKLLPKIEDYNKFDFDLCMNKFFDFMYEGWILFQKQVRIKYFRSLLNSNLRVK